MLLDITYYCQLKVNADRHNLLLLVQVTAVEDEAVYKKLDDRLVRAATTASSLEAEHDSGNIDKTQSKTTPNEASSLGTTSGGGPRCQYAMGDTIAQTRFENVFKHSNVSLLARGNTLQSDEDRMKLNKLMKLCTNLKSRVLDLKKTKTTQALDITSLKRRVKKLEKKQSSRTHKLKRLYKVGLTAKVDSSKDEQSLGEDASKQESLIDDIDQDEDITLVNDQDDAEMFEVNNLQGEEVFVEKEVVDKDVSAADEVNAASIATTNSAAATITTEEITLAQALVEIKTTKTKTKGIVLQEPRRTKTCKRKRAKKELEANIDLIETWDDVQAKIDADYQMAKRQQAEEQQELTDEEKAMFFMQLLEKRRKFFIAKRAEEKRNKPPTYAQQRKTTCTYLKNMEGKKLKDLKNKYFDFIQKMFDRAFKRRNKPPTYAQQRKTTCIYLKNMEGKKLKDLKNKYFDSIQKMFDRAFKRVNIFVDYKTELVEGSSKRAGEELTQESAKKQKVVDDKETAELKQLMEIIPDKEEEVEIDAIPLAVKSSRIVDQKI
nr:hypothetical protein [Tanacetum cinerariifolium]